MTSLDRETEVALGGASRTASTGARPDPPSDLYHLGLSLSSLSISSDGAGFENKYP